MRPANLFQKMRASKFLFRDRKWRSVKEFILLTACQVIHVYPYELTPIP